MSLRQPAVVGRAPPVEFGVDDRVADRIEFNDALVGAVRTLVVRNDNLAIACVYCIGAWPMEEARSAWLGLGC